ncbi:MAG TPA: hypothetical protein VFJ21_02235 [Mycobacteriales bacterium]|jgi:hypothetical protein|nr:hypothetical protein [Mycobacteriales bacterium]
MSELDQEPARPSTPDVLVIAPPSGPSRRRRVLPVVALAATVAVAGGTYAATRGSDSTLQSRPVASVTQLVHGAAAKTEAAKSSQFAMTMDMNFGGQSITATGSGAFDYAHETGDVLMVIPQIGQMRMLMVPGVFYMQMGGLMAKALPAGKSWVKVDLSEIGRLSGVDLQGLMDQAQQQNPVDNLKVLAQAGDVHKVGRDSVRGVPTTHYAGHVSIADVAGFYKGALSQQLSQLSQKMGNQPIGVDVWLDDQGLPRRMSESFSFDKTMTMRLTMDLYDFGAPVQVTPPPTSQVVDVTSLMGTRG